MLSDCLRLTTATAPGAPPLFHLFSELAPDVSSPYADCLHFKDDLDLILLDVTLPGGVSSREVVEEAQRTRAGLKIILTSAYGKEDIAPAFAGIGIGHFIRKPFVIADLMGLVQSVLSAP